MTRCLIKVIKVFLKEITFFINTPWTLIDCILDFIEFHSEGILYPMLNLKSNAFFMAEIRKIIFLS